jgi:flavin-dependent dehydrogenase
MPPHSNRENYDVAIIGAGLAGLALARQLLLYSGKTVLLIEKRAEIPPPRQKVGESTVQMSAFYFGKVLDLEEYLFREHYMKYNLRFYWRSPGRSNDSFEDVSHAYIRTFSNIPCYQLDRNKIEGEMLRRNNLDPRFTFHAPSSGLDIDLNEDGPHTLQYDYQGQKRSATADWVVDTSGRSKVLARKMGLRKQNPIRHGSSFFWVEGLVDIDKLTDLSRKELLAKPSRTSIGHSPFWLATNHFCGEGFWFWVIPLQGKTSLGLVYDNQLIDEREVWTAEKLVEWVCREFPLFARDLPYRKIIDRGFLRDFSYDCNQTISRHRWALSGEAGRFTDPLYSPGGDLISLHNTLIADAIMTDAGALPEKVRLYDQLMLAFYQATVPTYAVSYDALGDQETFVMKYVWELSVYFSFYVFPFMNGLFTDRIFIPLFLIRFARLGRINRALHDFLSAYFQWKKSNCPPPGEPVFFDFTELSALKVAESSFYKLGVAPRDAATILDSQLDNLRELARFEIASIYSVVVGDPDTVTNRSFVESIALDAVVFDPSAMAAHYSAHADCTELYNWPWDPWVMNRFHPDLATGSRGPDYEPALASAFTG